jgi:hypothetical protein
LAALGAALGYAGDPVAALARRIDHGSVRLPFVQPSGYLPALLEALHVPAESQMAVFSKTSIQSLRIEPANPRVLYFNDSVAVGWVRGGFIELAAQDPGHGIVFYTLQQRPGEKIERREDCLNCHKSGKTLLRSVTTTADGIPSGEADVDNRTPLDRLWGGWFVTGGPALQTKGNLVFENSQPRQLTPPGSSDIVALMVFAHQMRLMNLLAHPDNIDELADALLFADEAPLPAPIQASSGFVAKFSAAGPLRQFDLERRLMRYPCSYMIYSEAFDALPAVTKEAVYRRMWEILSGSDASDPSGRYRRLSTADRKAVIQILRETKTDLPAYFRNASLPAAAESTVKLHHR